MVLEKRAIFLELAVFFSPQGSLDEKWLSRLKIKIYQKENEWRHTWICVITGKNEFGVNWDDGKKPCRVCVVVKVR